MNELIIYNPFVPTERVANVAEFIDKYRERKDALVAEFESLGNLADQSTEKLCEMKNKLKENDDKLLAAAKNATAAALAATGMDVAMVQVFELRRKKDGVMNVRERIHEMLKAVTAELDGRKPPEVSRKRLVLVDCGDSAWKKIDTAIAKAGVKCGAYVELTNPEHIERVVKVIRAVEDERRAADERMAAM